MKRFVPLILLLLAVALVLPFAPLCGMTFIPLPATGTDREILLQLRIPRVLIAFVSGSMLGLSGMAFQALFRNPLATPYTLGVSSGAALGATLFIRFGIPFTVLGLSGISIAACGGAFLAMGLVYGFTLLKKGFSTATLLLAGVAVSFFFSSLILFVQYASGQSHAFRMMHWMMGSLVEADYARLISLLPFLCVGGLLILLLPREMNLLAIHEVIATSRGVNTRRVKQILFFAASLLVGGTVAVCGPIGFVGMMSPHLCRLLIGPDHRLLAPASLLFGGLFLTLCDLLARILIPGIEIPVGILTALIGGPFFLVLLLTRNEQSTL